MTYLEQYYLQKLLQNVTSEARHPLCVYGFGSIGQGLHQQLALSFPEKEVLVVDGAFNQLDCQQDEWRRNKSWLMETQNIYTVCVTPVRYQRQIALELQNHTRHQVIGLGLASLEAKLQILSALDSQQQFEELVKLVSEYPDEPGFWQALRDCSQDSVYQPVVDYLLKRRG